MFMKSFLCREDETGFLPQLTQMVHVVSATKPINQMHVEPSPSTRTIREEKKKWIEMIFYASEEILSFYNLDN